MEASGIIFQIIYLIFINFFKIFFYFLKKKKINKKKLGKRPTGKRTIKRYYQ